MPTQLPPLQTKIVFLLPVPAGLEKILPVLEQETELGGLDPVAGTPQLGVTEDGLVVKVSYVPLVLPTTYSPIYDVFVEESRPPPCHVALSSSMAEEGWVPSPTINDCETATSRTCKLEFEHAPGKLLGTFAGLQICTAFRTGPELVP